MSLWEKTKNYLVQLLIKDKRKSTAIIMDVDDTLVYTRSNGVSLIKYTKICHTEVFIFPGIKEMIEVTQVAKRLGYRVIILTARPKESYLSTKFNLDILKVPYDEIIMNTYKQDISFKYKIRQDILKRYKVLFSVGDQVADVNGPPGLLGIKLPSLDSNKVQIYSNICPYRSL